jgi:two-component system, NtrC family, nitrogen regulation sensor histidine kinase GlnL
VRDYDPSLPSLSVDRGQMIQALLNLARNALQAVGQDGRIVLRTRALSNYNLGGEQHRLVLSIEIEDSGPGIPDDLKETIFYPLVTGRTTGTGLGLTIAQDLVSRNGGLIEFTSRPGRTVFHMRLPATNGSGGGKS